MLFQTVSARLFIAVAILAVLNVPVVAVAAVSAAATSAVSSSVSSAAISGSFSQKQQRRLLSRKVHQLPIPASTPAAAVLPAPVTVLGELDVLRNEMGQAWQSWEETVSDVSSQVEELKTDTNKTEVLVSSLRGLKVPSVTDLCAKLIGCGDCAAVPVCGWCSASMKCIPGSTAGPFQAGSCATTAYSFASCVGLACESYITCAACSGDANCGWCGGGATISVGASSDAGGGGGLCTDGTEYGPSPRSDGRVPEGCPQQNVPTLSWVHRDSAEHQCAV